MLGSFFFPGRLGPMVTFTLKLGISILNGGNVVVQQVIIAILIQNDYLSD